MTSHENDLFYLENLDGLLERAFGEIGRPDSDAVKRLSIFLGWNTGMKRLGDIEQRYSGDAEMLDNVGYIKEKLNYFEILALDRIYSLPSVNTSLPSVNTIRLRKRKS